MNVTAHTDDTGAIVVQCDPVPLATRYRWRTLVVGVQTEYELAASFVDPMASIADVAPRQTVKIIVQAVNGSLQGVASDPIVFTFRSGKPAEPPKVSSQDAPAEKAASKTDGNGSENGNGHRAHSRAA